MDLDLSHPSIEDLRATAQKRIPKFAFEYLDSATGRERGLKINRDALDAIGFMPSVLCGRTKADLRTTLLGRTYDLPFGIAPVGMSGLMWAGAERMLAIPYAAELNDSTTMIGRQIDARSFAAMIRDEAHELRRSNHPVVMSVVLHSFISGQPWRLRPVAEALAEVAAMDEVWCATPSEIHAAVLAHPRLAAG